MTAIVSPTAALYEAQAATENASGYRAWNEGRIKAATALWLSAARWSQYARAYTCSTGPYTVEQVEGEACMRCGQLFAPGKNWRTVATAGDAQLFEHIECPKRGASR